MHVLRLEGKTPTDQNYYVKTKIKPCDGVFLFVADLYIGGLYYDSRAQYFNTEDYPTYKLAAINALEKLQDVHSLTLIETKTLKTA